MALIIKYNASTGSDTLASGAGPAVAITGSTSAHTNGVASTTITLTNTPDLSGVAADGTAAIWLNTTAGTRHLSKITAVDDVADTVTVEDSFNIALGSAVDYAIGGSRQTLENDTTNGDWADMKPGWTFEFDSGTYTVTTQISPAAAGDVTVGPMSFVAKSALSSGRPKVTSSSTSGRLFYLNTGNQSFVLSGIDIDHTGTWVGSNAVYIGNNIAMYLENCNVTSASGQTCYFTNSTSVIATNCLFKSTVVSAFWWNSGRPTALFDNCVFDNPNTDPCFRVNTSTTIHQISFDNCVFKNGQTGISLKGSLTNTTYTVKNCIFYNIATDAILFDSAPTLTCLFTSMNNIFHTITGYAINSSGGNRSFAADLNNNNAYYNVTAGNGNQVVPDNNAISLSADPFTDVANDDFSLNSSANGGALLKDSGIPLTHSSGTDVSIEVGLVGSAGTAGGGGSNPQPIIVYENIVR
jgi:hypothetical protein